MILSYHNIVYYYLRLQPARDAVGFQKETCFKVFFQTLGL